MGGTCSEVRQHYRPLQPQSPNVMRAARYLLEISMLWKTFRTSQNNVAKKLRYKHMCGAWCSGSAGLATTSNRLQALPRAGFVVNTLFLTSQSTLGCCMFAGFLPNDRAPDKWTILPQSEETGAGLMALKGGRADSELRKLRNEKRLRAPLQLPLFTNPLETGRAGNGKVRVTDAVPSP